MVQRAGRNISKKKLADGSVELVNHKSGAQLGFKPRGLGGHDIAGVCYIHELLHRHGIERQSHFHLSRIHSALEFAEAADTAHEVDALVAAQVSDAEYVAEYEIR